MVATASGFDGGIRRELPGPSEGKRTWPEARCCGSPRTCLCELTATIGDDILDFVLSMPMRYAS